MNLRHHLLLLALTAPAVAQDQSPEARPAADILKIDTTPPGLPHIRPVEHHDIVYRHASGVDQILDVYEQPGGKPAPVIVYWHGGAWWKGERPKTYASFRPLLNMGFSIVSVDYRLTGVAPAPAAVEDVRCSLAWVAKNAAEYHFDTKRIVAYGTSAGGHLALMAGFLPAKNNIDPTDCGPVPALAAIMDFYGIPGVDSIITTGVPLSKSTLRWIGGAGKDDPTTMKIARAMSPNTYLREGLPPVFIAHGDADPVVPYTQSTDLKVALEQRNIPVVMDSISGAGHGGFAPEQMARIYVDLLAFFRANNILQKP